MPAYDYLALDGNGRKVHGILEADSARHVRSQLKDKSLVPLEVNEAKKQSGDKKSLFDRNHLSINQLTLITRQLATLIKAGMPLESCLQAIAKQSEKHAARRIVLAVRAKVREGHTLADSLKQFPRAFPDLYCATVAAGERAGHLDMVLERLAEYTESQQEFKQKIQLALIYPILLLVMSLAIVTGLMVYIVPDIVQVIIDAGQQLPLLTELLVSCSNFLAKYGIYLLLAITLLVVLFRLWVRQPKTRLLWHRFLLNSWLSKRYSRESNAARYISTLAILTRSGITLSDAMPIASSVVANDAFRQSTEQAQQRVVEGISLFKALDETGYFPAMMLQLIASGEQSGELSEMLQRAATNQEEDLKRRVAMMVGLFEPLTLLLMGGVVLIIVLAVLLPILNLNQLVK